MGFLWRKSSFWSRYLKKHLSILFRVFCVFFQCNNVVYLVSDTNCDIYRNLLEHHVEHLYEPHYYIMRLQYFRRKVRRRKISESSFMLGNPCDTALAIISREATGRIIVVLRNRFLLDFDRTKMPFLLRVGGDTITFLLWKRGSPCISAYKDIKDLSVHK